jgi:hypothetical protein
MDTKPLASFAVNSRLRLLQSSKSMIAQALLPNSQNRLEKSSVVAELEKRISSSSLDEVAAEVSYLWFNRLLALTMLDAIGFNSPAAVTPLDGLVHPEILQEAKSGRVDPKTNSLESRERIKGLLVGQIPSTNMDAEIYGILLQGVTRSWGARFPMIFQANSEIAEMLAPSDLLSLDSIRSDFLKVIRGPYSKDVETIGWLFQFYNSDVKDSAFAKFKAGKKATHEDLVAATQFFTPRALANSMVENTLGSLWARMHPNSDLAKSLPEIARLDSDCPKVLTPEELTVMDPAVGSGNLLLSSFDYLEQIYLESGHNDQSIPGLILENNLHGLDIDPRAASLAAFAIWLRASRGLGRVAALDLPQPKITFLEDHPVILGVIENCKDAEIKERLTSLSNASNLGALLHLRKSDIDYLEADPEAQGLFLDRVHKAVQAFQPLGRKYAVVIANPPYMGPKNMPRALKDLIDRSFTEGKADLYGAFLIRAFGLIQEGGRIGFVTQASWLSLQRFQGLRTWFCRTAKDATLIRTDPKTFFGIGSFVDKALTFFGPVGSKVTRELGFSSAAGEYSEVHLSKFEVISGTPFAFGLPEHLIKAFAKAPAVGSIAKSNNGTKTGENEAFLRYWWEVNPSGIAVNLRGWDQAIGSGKKWFPYTKGGPPLKWYGNMTHVINWQNDGAEIRNGVKANGSRRYFQVMSKTMAFNEYICWSDISKASAFRFTPSGFMADLQSPALSSEDDFALLAFLNSDVSSALINALNPTIHIKIRDVENLPLLAPFEDLAPLGYAAVEGAKNLWDIQEVSMDFDVKTHLDFMRGGLSSYSAALNLFRGKNKSSLFEIQKRINEQVSPLYGFPWTSPPHEDSIESLAGSEAPNPVDKDLDLVDENCILAISLISGLILGRYLSQEGVTIETDGDNIMPLMLEDYFNDDFSSRLPSILKEIASEEQAESLNWLISKIGQPIRVYMRKMFYQHHLKTFSGAPVYWVIKSPDGHFQALTYIHRLNIDTFAICRQKYVQPLIEKLLTQQNAVTKTDQKKAEALGVQIKDLLVLDERLCEIVLNPPVLDFDQGVVKNHARFATVLQKIK